jgi:putative SOS response-associated peptidase YedK
MCGRLNITVSGVELARAFEVTHGAELLAGLPPRYNVAPSQIIPAIRWQDGDRAACLLRWGLIPSWAKDRDLSYKMINARAETVADKPAWRNAFRHRRCLIPVTGFYEWQQADDKQPYNITSTDGHPFALAGLWEHWEGDNEIVESCTIIVTTANAQMQPVHDRMPVILDPVDHDLWLDPGVADKERLLPLLRPYRHQLQIYPVSKRVNNPRNDDAACLATA